MRVPTNRLVAALMGAAVGTLVQTLPATVVAQGCAMCATAVDGDDPLARGLNISILFMLSMPFVLVGSVGAWFAYMYWRGHARRPPLRVLSSEGEGIL